MLTLPVMDKSVIAKSTASMLLEIEAVHVNAREPFILTAVAIPDRIAATRSSASVCSVRYKVISGVKPAPSGIAARIRSR